MVGVAILETSGNMTHLRFLFARIVFRRDPLLDEGMRELAERWRDLNDTPSDRTLRSGTNHQRRKRG
jgi:hypothetical protein